MNFPENMQMNNGEQLKKGEVVTVKGASQRRGHLLVESNGELTSIAFTLIINNILNFPGVVLNVPFQFLELISPRND
jgi:hypothetical protein